MLTLLKGDVTGFECFIPKSTYNTSLVALCDLTVILENNLDILKDLKTPLLHSMSRLKKEQEEIVVTIILNKEKIIRNMSVSYRSQGIKNAIKSQKEKEDEDKKLRRMKLIQKSSDLCPIYKNIKGEFENVIRYKMLEEEKEKVYFYIIKPII